MSDPVIVWLRRDLRLADQAALYAAAQAGPVIPVFVLDDETPGDWRAGGASRWWLHHSLTSLDAAFQANGARLILRRGRCEDVLAVIAQETGARRVHALHHYEPWWRNAERAVAARLDLVLHHGNYLVPPGSVLSGAGTPYRIFTPFWRALQLHLPPPLPLPVPQLAAPPSWPATERLTDWGLLPTAPDWAGGMRSTWTPGEAAAQDRLDAFVEAAAEYHSARNLPSEDGTSRLSAHLHFGEISPATVWHTVFGSDASAATYASELGWRDYAQNVILQFPDYGSRHARAVYDRMPWRTGAEADADLAAWCKGRTGYPIVDAGMRELWATGTMHNRVRMIAASFLIKHLLIDWRIGARWFWDTLVDADYASNAVNWQWSAGTGIDANMFGRIMAPLSQSAKFDAARYIRKWVPELVHLPDDAIHDPAASARPSGYPAPIINHAAARARALAAHAAIRMEP